jgi:hypothetical protein
MTKAHMAYGQVSEKKRGRVKDYCLKPTKFSAISWEEQANFQ